MTALAALRSDRMNASLRVRGSDGVWPEQPLNISEGDVVLAGIGMKLPLPAIYAPTHLRPG